MADEVLWWQREFKIPQADKQAVREVYPDWLLKWEEAMLHKKSLGSAQGCSG